MSFTFVFSPYFRSETSWVQVQTTRIFACSRWPMRTSRTLRGDYLLFFWARRPKMISSNHCQSLCAILKSNRRNIVFPIAVSDELAMEKKARMEKYNAAHRTENSIHPRCRCLGSCFWETIGCWETPVHVISTVSSTGYSSWSSIQLEMDEVVKKHRDSMHVCLLRLGIRARDKFMTARPFCAVLFVIPWLSCELCD